MKISKLIRKALEYDNNGDPLSDVISGDAEWADVLEYTVSLEEHIQQLESERRWIPAESLPELCRDYLCIFKDGFQTTMRWDGLHWFDVYDEGGLAYQPTHWMKLPSPPKENDK